MFVRTMGWLWVVVACLVTSHARSDAPPRLLVFPLEARGVGAALPEQLVGALAAEAPKVTRMRVTTVREVEKLLSMEQLKQLTGCSTASCATGIAAAVDGEQLVMGNVGRVGNEFVLSLTRMRTRDAVVLMRLSERAQTPKALLDGIPAIARKLFVDHKPPPVTMQLRVLAMRKGSATVEVLKGNEKLVQGDRVAFEFDVTPASHVYLMQRTKASGALNVLFPNEAIAVRNPIPPSRAVRIPDGEDWFELDDQDIGNENVFIVASPFELSGLDESVRKLESATGRAEAEQALAAIARDPSAKCASAQAGFEALAAGSGPCARQTRGLKLVSAAAKAQKPSTATVKSEEGDDTVMTVFTFEHVK